MSKLLPMHKQPVGRFTVFQYRDNNPGGNLEVNDWIVDREGDVYRLVESSGWGKRAAGELTPRSVKPPVEGAKAVFRDGKWWWEVD